MNSNELLTAISNMMDIKLKAELQPLKNDLQDMKSEIQSVKTELQGEIQSVKTELQAVNNNLQKEIHKLKLIQETQLLPRLDTIEACYTDTYKRYRNNADKMDSVFEDVALLKEVVTDHSKKLQNIIIAS